LKNDRSDLPNDDDGIENGAEVYGDTVKIYAMRPNHLHAIIWNIGVDPVGADLCVCPGDDRDGPMTEKTMPEKHVAKKRVTDEHKAGEHTGSPLHRVIQWFKTMITNEYIRGVKQHGWAPFPGKLWQGCVLGYQRGKSILTDFLFLQKELLLYLLLIMASDRNGFSFYSFDQYVCPLPVLGKSE